MKKYLFMAILLLLPVFVCAENASCYGQTADIYVNPGNVFIYDIGIGFNGGGIIAGIDYTIMYDEKNLDIIEVSAYNDWENVDYYIEDLSYVYDNLHINMSTNSLDKAILSNTSSLFDKIGYIKFRVKENAKGSARIQIMEDSVYYGLYQDVGDYCDPSTLSYIIININEKSDDTKLKNLSVDEYSITPKFDNTITNYNLSVKYNVESVNIKAECNGKNCKVEGIGQKSLETGVNSFKITVTAENGDENDYYLNVTREKDTRSDDATLKSLSIDNYSISPKFDKEINNYNLSVKYDVSSVNVIAMCNGKNCKVEGAGKKSLETGVNPIEITVIAENGNKNVYYLNVIREKDTRSGDATLKNVEITDSINNKLIDYSFKTDDYDYEINIPYSVKEIDFEILCNDNKCEYNEFKNQQLNVGENKISINVIAENGSKKNYTYHITRDDEPKQKLSSLKINGYDLQPIFSSDIYEYELTINDDVNVLDIDYTKENSYSKVEIIGNKNMSVNSISQIKIIVSGDNSNNDTTYTLNLNKVSKPIINDTDSNNITGLIILCIVLGLSLFGIISVIIYNKKNKN